jgi:pre-mRNA-splicing factor RBM22/SLT11
VVCREIALSKNVCQVCLLDLDYGIPVQARDAALGREREMLAKSDVNIEYQTEQIAKALANGEETYADSGVGKVRANELLNKLARKKPYYNKNKSPICTFWLRNACNRNDCPYRPCNGDTNMPELTSAPELRQQNIKDRYYGINDPVAEKMLKRAEETPTIAPPADASVTTLYVGGMDERVDEAALKDAFYGFGELKSIKCVHSRNCAFVTYTERAAAEAAAESLARNLVVNGIKLRLMWGKPSKNKSDGGDGGGGGGAIGGGGGASGSGSAAGGGRQPPGMMMMGAAPGGMMQIPAMGAPGMGMMAAPMMMAPPGGATMMGPPAPIGYMPMPMLMPMPVPYQPPPGATGGGGRGGGRGGGGRGGTGGRGGGDGSGNARPGPPPAQVAAMYPSMDPAAMGTRRADPAGAAAGAQQQQQQHK